MTHTQIIQDFRKGNFRPCYFLHGPEPYFIDQVSRFAEEHILDEAEKAFNLTVLYGKEADHLAVVDSARRYPMMAARQVVILKEAQEMRTLNELQGYIEKPSPTTVLVICYKHKTFKFNSAFGKLLKQHAVVMESKWLYDNQMPDWIAGYLKKDQLAIAPEAAALIAEYLGTDLAKVANELDKLALNLPAGTQVNTAHIEEHIGISKDYNIFELQKALGQLDRTKAARIVRYFAANPKRNPFPVITGSLYAYFSKIYMLHFLRNTPEKELLAALNLRSGFFLREYRSAAQKFNPAKCEQVFHILAEYDLKSKGVGYSATGKSDDGLLEEMVWKILH